MKHMLKASAATIALTISASTSPTWADDNFYIGLFGGLSLSGGELKASTSAFFSGNRIGQYFNSLTTRTNIFRQSQTTTWADDLDNGWIIGGALGYDLAHGPRIEIEEAYRHNGSSGSGRGREVASAHMRLFDGNSFTGSFDPIEIDAFDAGFDSTRTVWSLIANIWLDFEMGPVTPFVGGGLGLAFIDMTYAATELPDDFIGPVSCDRPDPYPDQCTAADAIPHEITINDNSWALAYQAGAGLAWALNDSSILSAQYRYFGTSEADLGNQENALDSHEILFGINIHFNPQ